MATSSADGRRKRGLMYTAITLLGVAVLAVGLWLFLGKDGPEPGCDRLLENQRIRSGIEAEHSADMSCGELGAAVKRSAMGSAAGQHTKAQAEAMKQVVLAVADTMDEDGSPVIAPGLRKPLAEALADYAGDVQEMLDGLDPQYLRSSAQDAPVWDEDEGGYHFSVPRGPLSAVLRAVSEDPTAYATLRNAQAAWGAEQLAAMPADAKDYVLIADATPLAAALGSYDAIADDVVKNKGSAHAGAWTDTAVAALRKPSSAATNTSALADLIAEKWADSLSAVPSKDRVNHLQQQNVIMFSAWAEAQKLPSGSADAVSTHCRQTAESARLAFPRQMADR